MPKYRCYPISLAGLIDGPAHQIDSIDDAAAVVMAYAQFPQRAFEVWLDARKVYASRRGDAAL